MSYDWLVQNVVPGTSNYHLLLYSPKIIVLKSIGCIRIRDFSRPPTLGPERRSCNNSHKSASANEHTRCNIVIVWLRADGEGEGFYLMIDGTDLCFNDMHQLMSLGFKVTAIMFICPLLFPP